MKKLLVVLLFASIFAIACNDDDATNCDVNDVQATLVGDWEEVPVAGVGGEVTFEADSTGTASDNSLFVTELNGVESKTFDWTVSADGNTLSLDYPNGLGFDYDVTSVECDKIVLDFGGITVTLNRD